MSGSAFRFLQLVGALCCTSAYTALFSGPGARGRGGGGGDEGWASMPVGTSKCTYLFTF